MERRKTLIYQGFFGFRGSFPFDGADGFGSEVHEDAVDAFHFVGDAVGDFMKDFVRNFFDGSGHGIGGVDGTDDSGPTFVAAFIFYANALDIRNGNEVLPYFFVQAVVFKFFAEDRIGFAERMETVAGDGAEATNTKTGAGEGLTVNHGRGET